MHDVHARVVQFADSIENEYIVHVGGRAPGDAATSAWKLLAAREYSGAVGLFRELLTTEPADPEIRFGLALALLQGIRPHRHGEAVIDRIVDHLRCCREVPHALMLEYIVAEDFGLYWRRVRSAKAPPHVRRLARAVAPRPARAILLHCPAREARSWRALAAALSTVDVDVNR